MRTAATSILVCCSRSAGIVLLIAILRPAVCRGGITVARQVTTAVRVPSVVGCMRVRVLTTCNSTYVP